VSRVVVVGSGPAGLVLGNLLRANGVECLILERRSRDHVERRARAGFLAANSVRVLTENGLAAGLLAKGQQHDTCAFRGDHGEFELKYSGLGQGEIHTVYPQQDLVRDLVAEFLDRGGEIQFETTVLAVDPDAASVMCESSTGEVRRLTGNYVVGCDGQHGVSRRAVPAGVARRFERDHGVTCWPSSPRRRQAWPR
jgi:p-hydroxybenzoate 3-monooxygenase